jgi:hypothetical protein
LGRGGFCVVNEIKKITLREDITNTMGSSRTESKYNVDDEDEHAIYNIFQDRHFMESHCIRGQSKDCRYAIKKMQASCYNDASTFINGIVDLALEAKFRAIVRHRI